MRLADRPLIGTSRSELDLTETLCVICCRISACHCHLVRIKRRRALYWCDREFERIIRRPITAFQGLLDLYFAFAGLVICVRECRNLYLFAI